MTTQRRVTRSRRRGFTLRELTLAIAVGSTVMMAAVGLVHHAFDWSKLARQRRMDDQTFFRLSRQLREDVHLTEQATLEPTNTSPGTLRLSLADGNSVTYSIVDDGLTRTESRDQVTLGREDYRFKHPRMISIDALDSRNQIQLKLESVTPFAASEVPLWRLLRVTIGLRLSHQNGEIAS